MFFGLLLGTEKFLSLFNIQSFSTCPLRAYCVVVWQALSVIVNHTHFHSTHSHTHTDTNLHTSTQSLFIFLPLLICASPNQPGFTLRERTLFSHHLSKESNQAILNLSLFITFKSSPRCSLLWGQVHGSFLSNIPPQHPANTFIKEIVCWAI